MTLPSAIGRSLVFARRSQGMTQHDLADRLGVKQPQIARWEATAYKAASLERLDAVAQALGEDLSSLASSEVAAEARASYTSLGPVPPRPSEADPLARLHIDPSALVLVCRRHDVAELALFGSVLRLDFRAESDVDVLVRFATDKSPNVASLLDLQDQLEALFGRRVDLVDRRAVERSRNYVLRRRILGEARNVYVA